MKKALIALMISGLVGFAAYGQDDRGPLFPRDCSCKAGSVTCGDFVSPCRGPSPHAAGKSIRRARRREELNERVNAETGKRDIETPTQSETQEGGKRESPRNTINHAPSPRSRHPSRSDLRASAC